MRQIDRLGVILNIGFVGLAVAEGWTLVLIFYVASAAVAFVVTAFAGDDS